jgi:hypothetical protein
MIFAGVCAFQVVMPGLVPGIHVRPAATKVVDGRDKPGHDEFDPNVVRKCDGPAQQAQGARPEPSPPHRA